MKRVVLLCLSVWLFGTACTTTNMSDWQNVAQVDITGDQALETIQIKKSELALVPELTSAYQFAFTELQVLSSDNTVLLEVTPDAITSEDGSKIRPVITSQSAYALGLGNGHLFYIVQIDSNGRAVSEPITFTWDTASNKWVMGK